MLKLKVGDKVKVMIGKDKGREGTVEKVDSRRGVLYIPGVSQYKRHVKGTTGQKGGIYDLSRPVPFSKVALVCPKCGKITRVSFKFVGDEKKRICAKCKREVDLKKTK
jgi:large subunit ribosomal protein L24